MRAGVALLVLSNLAHAQPAAIVDGASALEAGRLDDAERLLVAAKDATTRPGWRWFDLCLVHYAQGVFGRAIDACYRALQEPATRTRVAAMIEVIHAAMRTQQLATDALIPEPTPGWFDPEASIAQAITGTYDGGVGHATRAPAPRAADGTGLDEATLAQLTGRPPPLPYATPAAAHDYTRGYDVIAKAGVLRYAADASPFVVGVRGEHRRRAPGANLYTRYWGEYLSTVDGSGGILAGGVGAGSGGAYGETASGVEVGLSVPWGRDDGRQDVALPGYQIALMAELRYSYRYDIGALAIEASIAGGLNLGKLANSIGRGFERFDDCAGDEDCPPDRDPAPDWRWTYVMAQLGVGFGTRSGRPRYHRAEVFAPTGSTP